MTAMISSINKFLTEVENEVKGNILPFWMNHVVDRENGGFYGRITNELEILREAEKGSILNARIMWTYSAAYRALKDPEYLRIAARAYDYIIKYFWDNEYSGLFWMLDCNGNVVNTRKQIYNQAFGIYGFSEYYRATGDTESLNKAVQLFRAIEEKSYDSQNKGYFEALSREWQPIEDMRLSTKDMNEKKSMNTHLHILEGYTNLYRVWKDEGLERKLRELIDVTINHIIDPQTHHFKLFFDECWNSKVDMISFGHDIEGSWLLYEAAEVLGDKNLMNVIKSISIKMAQKTYEEGIDTEMGGLYDESEGGRLVHTDKIWWGQAEAMVGFLNAFELTSEEHFFDAASDMWRFITNYIVDKENGDWFWKTTREGSAYKDCFKVEPWKCPYHSARACFEVISRLRKHAAEPKSEKVCV